MDHKKIEIVLDGITSFLILFAVGTLAGFINVFAGGGSTIALPALIFLGLDATVANGTNRIAIFFQNVSAVSSFKKGKYSRFKLSFKMALFTLPGAIIGAIVATKINNGLFETLLGIVMIGVIITMLIPKKQKFYEKVTEKVPTSVYFAMVAIGFYGGFIQVGIGFILMSVLHYMLKENLVYVNVHKVFIVLIYTIPALLIFIISGNIDWGLGLSLAAGNSFGAWWAAKLSIKKGEKLIRWVLVAAILIMSLKLLGVFNGG